MCQTIRPFDRQHAVPEADLLETEIICCRTFKPVKVCMVERQAVPTVLMHNRERRAADLVWIDSKPLREATYKGRLPRPEVARNQQHVAGSKRRRQFTGKRLGFSFRPRERASDH